MQVQKMRGGYVGPNRNQMHNNNNNMRSGRFGVNKNYHQNRQNQNRPYFKHNPK